MSRVNNSLTLQAHDDNCPSLNLSFELTRERLTYQIDQANALDTKANFIFGSATAFVSAALVLEAVLLTSHNTLKNPQDFLLYILPLIALITAFLGALLSTLGAYRIRSYKRVPNPRELQKNYLQRPEYITKMDLFNIMVEAFARNEIVLKKKIAWTKLAFIFLGSEAIILVFFLSLQVIN